MIKYLPSIIFMAISSLIMLDGASSSIWKWNLMQGQLFNFSFTINQTSQTFIMMVTMVTMVIAFYASFYMEFYNKDKFFILTMLFFSSMVILSVSSDSISTMLGWDGLGISSICLIMMYQSKSTMGNSILTMYFNRMGDVMMMMGLILSSFYVNSSSFIPFKEMSFYSLVIFMLASMTKSAQFPLSTWLPAAMSAPTPISAMVHSSTLVTAGIYLFSKLLELMKLSGIVLLMTVISSLSMITAGMSALYESDLKKVVAYSTMSHISIMMFMVSMNMKMMAMIHMMAHAMFKTSIFMSGGMIFLSVWGNQQNSTLSLPNKSSQVVKSTMKLSMVSLSGVPFSSSFFSKDLFLEKIMMSSLKMGEVLVMFTSIMLTMMYSKKIMDSIKEASSVLKTFCIKMISYKSNILMCVFSLMGSSIINMLWITYNNPMIYKLELMLPLAFMFVMIFKSKLNKSKTYMILSTSMIMKGFVSVSMMKKLILGKDIINMTDYYLTSGVLWKIILTMNKSLFLTCLSMSMVMLMAMLTISNL